MMGGMGGPRSLWSRSPINSSTVHRAWWSRTERWSRDSWKLLVAFGNYSAWSPPPSALLQQPSQSSSSLRDIVWQQAAEHNNQVARQVLQWEREVNLLRYYGPRGYLREKRKLMGAGSSSNNSIVSRWFFLPNNNNTQRLASTFAAGSDVSATGSSSTTASAAAASSSTPDNNETNTISSNTMEQEASLVPASPVVAKIPFMITARMRQDLIELGYEPSQIATLIPLHAMLLLDHQVTPEQMELDLPQLIQDHEAQQRQAAAEHARKQQEELLEQQQQKLEAAEAAQETEPARHAEKSTAIHIPSEVPQPAELTPAEAVLVEAPFAAEPALVQGTTWHQVIEIMAPTTNEEDTTTNTTTSSTNNNNVVGMFLDRQEAEFARSVHEDLAVERSARQTKNDNHQHYHGSTRPSTFEIRTIVKD